MPLTIQQYSTNYNLVRNLKKKIVRIIYQTTPENDTILIEVFSEDPERLAIDYSFRQFTVMQCRYDIITRYV